jgi:hypothetical protein
MRPISIGNSHYRQTCLKNINAGAPFPGRREDFQSESAWHSWRTLETSHLSQLIVQMMKTNPELAKSTPSEILPSLQTANIRPMSSYASFGVDSPGGASRHDSVGSRRSFYVGSNVDHNINEMGNDVDVDEEVPIGHHFTYIPPNPKKYYQRLVEYCLVADLEKMLGPEVDDNEEVSLGILSPTHIEIINECAMRWRIGPPYRAVCFLDLVKQFYERTDVPLECVPEALQMVKKALQDNDLEKWPISEVSPHPILNDTP